MDKHNFIDLIYFGYAHDVKTRVYEHEFITEIKEHFPNIKIRNAFDPIKGNRQEIELALELRRNYLAWLIAFNWHKCSMTFLIEKKEELIGYLKLAKEKYPEKFQK